MMLDPAQRPGSVYLYFCSLFSHGIEVHVEVRIRYVSYSQTYAAVELLGTLVDSISYISKAFLPFSYLGALKSCSFTFSISNHPAILRVIHHRTYNPVYPKTQILVALVYRLLKSYDALCHRSADDGRASSLGLVIVRILQSLCSGASGGKFGFN